MTDISINLTDGQVATIMALARYRDGEIRAHNEYQVVLTRLADIGLHAHMVHTGGNIWLVEVELEEYTWDLDGEPSHPRIWINKSEFGEGWRICAYLDHFDDAGVFNAPGVLTHMIPAVMARALDQLRAAAETRKSIEAVSDMPMNLDSAIGWVLTQVNDIALKDQVWSSLTSEDGQWVVTVMVEPVYINYAEWDEERGWRRNEGHSVYNVRILELTDQAGTQKYLLYWHDGVVNEWVETFDTYAEAAHRFGVLFEAAVLGKLMDEIEPPKPELEDMLTHFQTKHTDIASSEWRVRIWWRDDRTALGYMINDRAWVLEAHYESARTGESGSDEDYICDLCDAYLDLGELEISS